MNRKMRRAEKRRIGRHSELAGRDEASSFAEAVRCYQFGQFAEAVALYDGILSLKPDLPEVHCNRGAALAGLGRLGDAEAAYRRAIALNPDFANAYNNLGNVLREHGRLDDAERAFRHAIRRKPEWPLAHSNLGIALKSQGRLDDAEAAFRRAIALNPHAPDAYGNLGDVLWCLGRLDDAEKALRRAIALSPQFAEAFTNLGNTLRAQGKLGEAESAHRQAIALKPHFAQAYNNLGNVLLDLGRLDDAEKALRHAIALSPQFAEAFTNLGCTLREQGRLGDAETACRQAIALRPDQAELHSNLGNVLRDQDKLIEAEAAYRHAIVLKPNFADAYKNLGSTLMYLGRLADARQAMELAVQLAPRNASAFLILSEVRHFGAGDPFLAAMEELAQNIASLPVTQQIELHFALAKAYEDVGRRDDSFRQLLAGNALKRGQIAYDETATLGAAERIRAVFTPELMRRLQDFGEPSSVPLFIVGMPRSGTTLIEQILASHPQVFGAGELPNLGKAAVSIRPTEGGTLPFPDAMLNISGEHLQRLGARYVSAITQLAPTATHITDKMPSNFFFAGLLHLALPNARIIHAVRNPIDTCMSCFSKLFTAGQHYTYDLAELGRYYRHYQSLMAHWHRLLPPGRILDVRYEDVVADLEGQARRIVAHCGLEWNASCLAFHQTERPVRTASATQVRKPIYKSAIRRWLADEAFLMPLLDELRI
jgi:tetratricopeptide (TPR) repeat protein